MKAQSLRLFSLSCLLVFSTSSFLIFSSTSYAHEGRPVYIELRETELLKEDETLYTLKWKVPPVFAANTEPNIILQNHECESVPSTSKQKLTGTIQYFCSRVLSKLKIEITYPTINPALSSLLVFYNLAGTSTHTYSDPETLIIPINKDMDLYQVAKQYIKGGIKHILFGWDHLSFVICLMVLSVSYSRLFVTITGFTLAHTVTLLATTLDFITVPFQFIEILIALSILILAAEIIRQPKRDMQSSPTLSRRYPVVAAILLGLLHGFGFASVLSDLGLPDNVKTSALLFFNLGIEIGQILFIVTILTIGFLLQQNSLFNQYKKPIRSGFIYFIGVLASFWVVERLVISL
jgi:hydrogenase/urease accessory protein HupE